MPCAVDLPMALRLHDRESLQMAEQAVPSAQAFTTGMTARNDPGGSSGGLPGAFVVQGRAPLPVFWAPMPLPGLLQTSSSFADSMRALARSERSGAIFVFSSFCGRPCIEKVQPLPHQPIRAPRNYRQCGGTCVKGFHGQEACCTDWIHMVV